MITNYISNACGYKIPRLKDVVYLVDKSTSKVINIDSGEASVTITNTSPTRLEGFDIRLTEEESLDERYLFVKTVNVSINGHFSIINDDYLVVVEDYEGNYYLVNVDFPSKTTYTYTLSEGKDQTDLTFTSNSNYPLLKLTWNVVNTTNCKVYSYGGIKNLKLIEKGWARVDTENDSITLYDNHTFKDVDFNDASCVLTETYDGNNITNSITFDIPLDKAQSSWQYNLIEFKQNVYIAEILPKNSDHALMIGFENGLQPSYNVQGSASNGDTSKITITLEETSHRGLEELVNWSVNQDTNKKWVYIKQIDHRNAYTCIGHGVGRYDYMAEVDQDGNVLGNYKIYSGANRNKFPYINIVGYFNDVVTFSSTICSCSDEYMYEFNNHYYCVNGDKVQALESIHTYDCGRSGEINGTGSPISDYTKLGALVEPHSNFCDTNVEYMWVLKTDKFECVSLENRWVESGYTCGGAMGYDKYLVEKEQIWDSNQGWVDTNPLVTRETLVEKKSQDCGYEPPFDGKLRLDNSIIIPCDSTSATTRRDFSAYSATVESVEVGECVTNIGYDTFLNCPVLTSVTLSDSVTSLDITAFRQASAMTTVNIPDSVTYIGNSAFAYCESLKRINSNIDGFFNIPNSVTYIGSGAFTACYKLANMAIPDGFTNVPDNLFNGCTGLTSITIPTSVTTIGNSAFIRCTSLTGITIPSAVTSIGYAAFGWCEKLRTITIPSGVTVIENETFSRCYKLASVNMSSHITSIGNKAFYYCTGLTSVTLPDSVTSIGDYVFYDCSITSVTLPDSVTSIGEYVFDSCGNLASVTVLATTPPTLGVNAFFSTPITQGWGTIYVPAESVEVYKAANNWNIYADRIQPIPT